MNQTFLLVQAIDEFIVGCKSDGIWDAIKACCIMSGWDSLTGALIPLKGTAPTNNNFVSADYNRKTGLKGNRSSKYLNTNRSTLSDPIDSVHIGAYMTEGTSGNPDTIIGSLTSLTDGVWIGTDSGNKWQIFCRSSKVNLGNWTTQTYGFIATNRPNSTTQQIRLATATTSYSKTSVSPQTSRNYGVFRNLNQYSSDSRLSFYSIGESLDLEKLDTRVTTLMNTFSSVIP